MSRRRLVAGVFVAALVLVAVTPALASASPSPGSGPTITTQAASAVVEQPIYDTATLSGGNSPTGSVTWNLYAANSGCVTSVDRVSVPVNGDGVYASPSFTPAWVGTYQWVATYSGDVNNSSVSSFCDDTNGQSVVSKASPSITTTATSNTVGQPIDDTATLSGGDSPRGWITWYLYEANTGCVKSVDPVSVPVDGDGMYTTPQITPAYAGTYQWVAAYSGDDNNNPTSSTCDDVNEQSVLSKASPSIATTASSNTLGQPIDDTATLSGGDSPTGALRWSLYSAGTGCVTPLFTSTPVAVGGDGTYTSPSFTPTSAGTYQWVASYGGDTNNNSIASSCTDSNEQSVVSQASPSLATSATPSVTLGQPISDSATLSGGYSPGGTITWSVYAAGSNCSTPLFTTGAVTVDGGGTYASPSFTPTSAGTYQWVASYSGDVNNVALSSACDVTAEQSVVQPPATQIPPTTPSGSPTPPAPSGSPTPTAQAVKAVKVLRCARGKVKKHKKVHGKTVTVCVKKRVKAAVHRRIPQPRFTG